MYRAGCRTVFLGFEAVTAESLKEVKKHKNVGVDYKQVVGNLHRHKISVIASTILGMDSHGGDYHRRLIRELKESKADFPRVFLMTAWPGTPLFDRLEKEGRACRDWDHLRKDEPSIQFKNYTHAEIVRARSEVLRAFFNPLNMLLVMSRWAYREHSLGDLFIRMAYRHRIAERIKRLRTRPAAGSGEGR